MHTFQRDHGFDLHIIWWRFTLDRELESRTGKFLFLLLDYEAQKVIVFKTYSGMRGGGRG